MSDSMTDDDLEARLRDYGRVLERELGPASVGEVVHHPAGHRRRAGLVAVAATLLLVGGTAVLAQIGRSGTDGGIVPAATDSPPEPDPEPNPEPNPEPDPRQPADILAPTPEESTDGIEGCTHLVEEVRSSRDQLGFDPFDGLFDPRANTREALVLAIPDSPGALRVLLRGNDGFYTCRVSRSGAPLAGAGHGTAEQMGRPEPDRLRLLDRGGTPPQLATTGPGSFTAFGRAGADVEAVWAELPDGTIAAGVLNESGWFTIEGNLGDGDPLFTERYVWVLRNGSTRNAMAEEITVDSPPTTG